MIDEKSIYTSPAVGHIMGVKAVGEMMTGFFTGQSDEYW
jgi:hypothetical protein